MRIIVLSGVSGAGKTYFVENSIQSVIKNAKCIRFDDYFMVDGVYRFDPKKVVAAYAHCFRQFIEACQISSELIVIDNTNTTVEEISPYVLGGEAYGYQTEVVTFITRTGHRGLYDLLESCVARNVHGIPSHVVFAQHKRIMSRALPTHWGHTFIPVSINEDASPVLKAIPEQWIPKALQKGG